jgi:peptide deformylase
MGHPVLRSQAQPVADVTSAEMRGLVQDMVDSMEAAGGVGLAAPQIGVPLRLVVFDVPAARAGGEEWPRTVLFNPVIEPIGTEEELAFEACLSVPGLMGEVPRWAKIRYTGLDADGKPIDRIAEGFHARVVQHECDHLDGILYPARVRDFTRFGFVEEFRSADGEAEEVVD